MRYRVCKAFEIESGHMLSKHPSRCRYPHGHSRRVEVVVSSEALDGHDMVCDFKAIKLTIEAYLDRLDHAMLINRADPALPALRESGVGERLIELDEDPTTEVLARLIYEHVGARMMSPEPVTDRGEVEYRFPPGIRLERVRVSETSTSWAEYGRE